MHCLPSNTPRKQMRMMGAENPRRRKKKGNLEMQNQEITKRTRLQNMMCMWMGIMGCGDAAQVAKRL